MLQHAPAGPLRKLLIELLPHSEARSQRERESQKRVRKGPLGSESAGKRRSDGLTDQQSEGDVCPSGGF